MKIIYSDYVGKEISKEILDSLIRDEQRQVNTTEYVINEKFGKGGNSMLSGNELIVKDILLTYLKKILDSDRLLTPITILELEETYNFKITLNNGKSGISIRTGGHIDRVDKVEDTIRIVDYKTGKVAEKINSIGDLFTDDRQKDIDGWLQTLLYCEAYTSDCQGSIIRPSVYKIKELTGEDITDRLVIKRDKGNVLIVNDYSEVREEFINGLYETIRTIFSKDEPFIMTSDNRKCIYCPYHTLCMR
jgi:CRISPR/Cas system-associated exonuclease Cas4 (RecB family)